VVSHAATSFPLETFILDSLEPELRRLTILVVTGAADNRDLVVYD